MEVFLNSGVNFIINLQKSWAGWEREMLFLSKVGDPRNSFLIYFPVVYHLNHNLGVGVLWTTIISEWLNLVLKWILRGDRPYWWIHESTEWENVTLQQFELTCETGPGSPSGHSMVTSAVLCLLVLWLMNSLKEKFLCNAYILSSFIITVAIWSMLFIVLSLVSLSRVFIATHFPHQVVLGTVTGIFLAFSVRKHSSLLLKISHSVALSAICSTGMVVITLVSYFILSILVYDPSISVTKAQRWCVKPSYIHLDTTPFYALVRDTGATLGLGISFSIVEFALRVGMNNWRSLRNIQMPLLSRALKIILSVVLLQLLEIISLPKSSPLLFYLAGFCRCSLIPVIVIFVVPMIVIS